MGFKLYLPSNHANGSWPQNVRFHDCWRDDVHHLLCFLHLHSFVAQGYLSMNTMRSHMPPNATPPTSGLGGSTNSTAGQASPLSSPSTGEDRQGPLEPLDQRRFHGARLFVCDSTGPQPKTRSRRQVLRTRNEKTRAMWRFFHEVARRENPSWDKNTPRNFL